MKKNKYEHLSLDLTPLIDIVFILLIFFIISSSFKKEKFVLDLKLPDSSSTQKLVNKKQISIEVNKNNFAYMGKKITIVELQMELENIINKDKPIIIKIHKEVAYKKVILVLDLLQLNKINNISFVTKNK